MKKFSFSLENVLRYKNQLVDGLNAERAALLLRVRKQEEKIETLKNRYREMNQQYAEQKAIGFTVAEAREYEAFFRSMERVIEQELRVLDELRKAEEEKRAEMIEARKESMSIEKLREKEHEAYNKMVQKTEEQMIEEFVSNSRAAEVRV
nr:flagellar export protein FliJ [uncultured Butyricicoccus sp.]